MTRLSRETRRQAVKAQWVGYCALGLNIGVASGFVVQGIAENKDFTLFLGLCNSAMAAYLGFKARSINRIISSFLLPSQRAGFRHMAQIHGLVAYLFGVGITTLILYPHIAVVCLAPLLPALLILPALQNNALDRI